MELCKNNPRHGDKSTETTHTMNAQFKTIDDVKSAIDSGSKVFWKNQGYRAIKDKIGNYLVLCLTGYCIRLYGHKPEDFFTIETP
jgi:hypothetical protein